MSRWGETFAALSGGSDTLDTIRHSGDPLSIVSHSVNSVTAAPTPSGPSIPPAVDRALAIWGEAEAERAVIVADEGAIPRTSLVPRDTAPTLPPTRWARLPPGEGRSDRKITPCGRGSGSGFSRQITILRTWMRSPW